MDNKVKKLSLDRPAKYEIIVPGVLDSQWVQEDRILSITTGKDNHGRPISIIIGDMDQAALQGVLSRLFNLGLPLISVNWLESSQ